MNIIKIDSTESTNNYLRDLWEETELQDGTVVYAEQQTMGRGQAGSCWEAEPGKNLTCSILFYPDFVTLSDFFLLSKIVAVGIVSTLSEYSQKEFLIKWPNDIYVDNKKIAGVLIENNIEDFSITRSIVGIGVNLNQREFKSSAPNPVSLINLIDTEVDVTEFLQKLQSNIMCWYNRAKEGLCNYYFISHFYHKYLYRKTGFHYFEDEDEVFEAQISSVEDDGHLVLETRNGEKKSYLFKEVKFVNGK
ncbi:BirA family biotin operon repressor/biotin-[acetyl-CoA-carboxylase] ligase [Dysgonomonadaceae bacterium PH5-43]|nr:BirA family biotin operon repressor/biotin-[acetyl-CoA-carboxylase] ligase [Dysgonomonadaceae bacterium PH5-43]